MTKISRRLALVGALSAFVTAARAEDKVRVVGLKKVFPYLDLFYQLPPAERSHFRLVYKLLVKGAPASTLRAAYLIDGQRSPVRFGPDMQVLNPPAFGALAAGRIEMATPMGAKIALELEVAPVAAPALQMDAHDLAEALRQSSAAVHKAAGPMSFAAPKMERAVFKGASGGQIITASGQASPLPMVNGAPVFDPAKAPNARWLRFSRAPASITLGPAK